MDRIVREEKVAIGALRLNVVVGAESGPPLLLLHGIGQHWQSFRAVIPDLAEGHQIFAPDFRGCGRSDHADGAYRIADYAADVVALIRRRISRPVDLAGHSLGAHVGLMVAATQPELVRTLTLEEIPVQIDGERIVPRQAAERFRRWRDEIENRGGSQSDPEFDLRALDVFIDGTPFDDFDPDRMIGAVRCPVLLIAADPTLAARLEPSALERMKALAGECKTETIAGAGHSIHHDDPAAYVRVLTRFLAAA